MPIYNSDDTRLVTAAVIIFHDNAGSNSVTFGKNGLIGSNSVVFNDINSSEEVAGSTGVFLL